VALVVVDKAITTQNPNRYKKVEFMASS